MTTPKRSVERWTDDDVSALLDIYADDAIQGLQLKAVSNAKMYECISQELAAIGIIHGAKSCRDKIKKLKQDFKKIKDHNNKSGNGRKTSKWYDRLNALLGHRPSFVGTANTIASSTMGWEDAMAEELSKDDDELGKIYYMHCTVLICTIMVTYRRAGFILEVGGPKKCVCMAQSQTTPYTLHTPPP